MSDKFKNSKFYQAMKNPKVSRAIYISMVLVLVAIAVVIGITVAANRTKKPVKDPSSVTTTPSVNDTGNTPNGTEQPNDTQAPDDTTGSSGPVSKPLPTFSLPRHQDHVLSMTLPSLPLFFLHLFSEFRQFTKTQKNH